MSVPLTVKRLVVRFDDAAAMMLFLDRSMAVSVKVMVGEMTLSSSRSTTISVSNAVAEMSTSPPMLCEFARKPWALLVF
jgi:hypothetical protein